MYYLRIVITLLVFTFMVAPTITPTMNGLLLQSL